MCVFRSALMSLHCQRIATAKAGVKLLQLYACKEHELIVTAVRTSNNIK
jgi:hypothetical protein